MFKEIKDDVEARMIASIQSFKSDMQGIAQVEHLRAC